MRTQDSNRLIKHGMTAMLVALLAGFGLMFFMLGGVSLWPLPAFIQWDLPGTVQGWRSLHLGMMMNGMMAVVLGIAGRSLAVTDHGSSIVSWGTIVAVWGNFCFYLFGMFAPNHGLTMGANRLGEASLAGSLAFLPAFIGVVTLPVALIVLLGSKSNSIFQSNSGRAQ